MPNSNIVSARGAGLATGGKNNPAAFNGQDYHSFNRSQTFYQTQRIAECNPVFAKKFTSADKVRIRSCHELRSYTLKSPLMSDVYMNRAHFVVPLQAIYHNTFKLFFEPPKVGSDISDSQKPMMPLDRIRGNVSYSLYDWLKNRTSVLSGSTSSQDSVFYLNALFLLLQMFSKDGLLQKLGYSISGYDVDKLYNIFLFEPFNRDYQINVMSIGFVNNDGNNASLDLTNGRLTVSSNTYDLNLSDYRNLIYDLVNNKYEITSFFCDAFDTGSGGHGDAQFVSDVFAIIDAIPAFSDEYINIEKVIAYQYVMAQFYSNSFVDDIFEARQWENNIIAIINSTIRLSSSSAVRGFPTSFTLNGVNYNYDLVQQRMLINLFACFNTSVPIADALKFILCLRNIFEVHYSLRLRDYFLDSRVRPLAVGDVYSAVVSNQVSAIDINKSLWIQRFLNAVNRIPSHIETYLKEMFGVEPQTKEPKPYFISKERFLIKGQEIENTADSEQGKVVTNLRTANSNYFFETFVSEPSIIIGISSYSMDYAYSTAMDKEFLEFDRLDNFNPYFQHVGDQSLLARELDNNPKRFTLASVFSYQDRYMQYKKSINHVSGGFIDNLPSWVALYEKTGDFDNISHLSSDFIRNNNSDFDAFYSSLTGENPCEYFHFIARFDTICHVNSRMQKNPSLM